MGLLLPIVAMVGFSSCNKTNEAIAPESIETRAKEVVTLSGILSGTDQLNWTKDKIYRLDGKVYVQKGDILKIQEGTEVRGVFKEDPYSASALIVVSGAQIEAIGTPTEPIVMTAENGKKGGWGGIVILGNAPINQKERQVIEGIDPTITVIPGNIDVTYGGSNAADNSGTLKYVRVEYAGAEVKPTKELNAFTFGGVGNKTTLSHLQAYHGADDGFEFFGGTVNADHLVATAVDDDSFDFDFGYTGTVEFSVATINKSMSYSSDPNGIECDNDGDSSSNTPFTRPVLKNLTIVGTKDGIVAGGGDKNNPLHLKAGAHFRRNTQFELYNSVICGFPKGIYYDKANSNYVMKNNYITSEPAGNEFVNFTPDASNLIKMPLRSPYSGRVSGLISSAGGVGAFANGSTWFTSGSWVKGYVK